MSMKLKQLFLAALAVFALSACSNDNDDVDTGKVQPSELKVIVKIPGLENNTKGAIVDPIPNTDLSPKITKATVYVLNSTGGEIAKKDVAFTGGDYNSGKAVTFEAIPLGGGEKVVVSANVGATAGTSEFTVVGKDVKDIQPVAGGNEGIQNVFYRGEATVVASSLPGNSDGHKVYESTVTVAALAARVEITDNIKFNTDLVKDLFVDVVVPSNYTKEYGATTKVTPNSTAKGDLWLDLTAANYGTDITGGKAVANHLFAGDEQRIAFRINANIFNYKKNEDGKAIKITIAARDIDSYVFLADDGEYYVENNTGDLFGYSENAKGEAVIEDTATSGVTKSTYNTVTEKSGFFTMVNFHKNADNTLIHDGKYLGGIIYKIKFSEIDWNGDGKIDDQDIYNPDENGGGTEEPAETADLIVIATIADWTIENVFPGIE